MAGEGAVADGRVWVDEFLCASHVTEAARTTRPLQVKSSTPDSSLTRDYYAVGDCCSSPYWKTILGADMDAGRYATSTSSSEVGGS
jgi:hypothetical protein